MKVLLVNGSPHEQGCTNRALEELQAQFAREDAEAEIFWLGKSMQPCIACNRCAGLGRVEDTASRIARGASRATGQREAAERVLLCLEVLAERGLIDLEIGPQGVAVSLRQVERKVDLEASPILGRLRQAIRGGSAEA